MGKSNRQANSEYRDAVLKKISDFLIVQCGEDVIQTASNTITFPFVNEISSDEWIKIVISVPEGSRTGDPFDGYEQGEDYTRTIEEKKFKEAEVAEKKKKQIEYSQKKREIAKKRKEGTG